MKTTQRISPISESDAYNFYYECYENGLYSLEQLREKYKDYQAHTPEWENFTKKDVFAKRDYDSFINMQNALKMVIKNIWKENFIFEPVPQDINQLNLSNEVKKIEIINQILLCTARKHPFGKADDYYHNLRAFLIGRIEQASAYKLIVVYDFADSSKIIIRDRKEYLKEKLGDCHSSLCKGCTDNCDRRC